MHVPAWPLPLPTPVRLQGRPAGPSHGDDRVGAGVRAHVARRAGGLGGRPGPWASVVTSQQGNLGTEKGGRGCVKGAGPRAPRAAWQSGTSLNWARPGRRSCSSATVASSRESPSTGKRHAVGKVPQLAVGNVPQLANGSGVGRLPLVLVWAASSRESPSTGKRYGSRDRSLNWQSGKSLNWLTDRALVASRWSW